MRHMEYLTAWFTTFGVIFAIVDPFGYVPVFLSMTAQDTEEQRRRMVRKACFAAGLVLTFFTFFGNGILGFFGISIPALQISGGLILLVIGFDMLNVLRVNEKLSQTDEAEGVKKEDISIIPLAIPMLSGPASIATVMVLSSESETPVDTVIILVSVVLTLAFTYLILKSGSQIQKHLGVSGLNVVTRVMGLLLCAMAVQFVINGWTAIR